MNFYLSSYKIGTKEAVKKLKELIPFNKKTAYISLMPLIFSMI